MDTFICGTCQGAFNDIEVFMQHKQAGCSRPSPEIIQVHVDGSGEVTEVTGSESVMEDGSSASPTTLAFLNEMNADGQLATMQGQDSEGATHTYIILNDSNAITTNAMQLQTLPVATTTTEEEGTAVSQATAVVAVEGGGGGASGEGEVPVKKTPGRRGRRPKNLGEVKVEVMEAVSSTPTKPDVPEKDKDGKLRCPNCQRVFNKERHFKTHKCLASSLYVDISKRDVKLDSGDEEEPEETEAGAVDDEQEEYKAQPETEHSEDSEAMGEEDGEGRPRRNTEAVRNIQLHTDADTEAGSKDRSTQGIEDVPIFRTDEEKIEFESTLNVDLSCVDHMFKVHVIDQDINENAGTYGRGQLSSLSLYSCTVCEKVFKTLSHMRLHCLVHTTLKPFRCNKCQYATNTKGNLYTHMRKHTGQYYQCKSCDFRSVNKSHLLEHEATHDKKRHPCAICNKDYATGKSLVNHVRKYHAKSRKGQQYLQTFLQGRQSSGSTVIHQCHVCNRKFKKKIDRDRHLFVHDIHDMNMTHQCELCDYQASRRVYLEKHYLKHRVLYCCSLCSAMFLSTVKLLEHLSNSHGEEQAAGGCEELFERCINNSLYLPEPDEQLPVEDKQFINLPPELSSSAINSNNTTTTSNMATPADNLPSDMLGDGSGLMEGGEERMETGMDSSSGGVDGSPGEGPAALAVVDASLGGQNNLSGLAEAASGLHDTSTDLGKPEQGMPNSTDLAEADPAMPDTATERTEAAAVSPGAVSAVKDAAAAMADGSQPATESMELSGVGEGEMELEAVNSQAVDSHDVLTADSQEVQKADEGEVKQLAMDGPAVSNRITVMVNEEGVMAMTTVVPTPPVDEIKEGAGTSTSDNGGALPSDPAACPPEISSTVADPTIPLAPNPGHADETPDNAEEGEEELSKEDEEGEGAGGEEEGEDGGGDKANGKKTIVERLGFRQMNMQIFQKMRETFGSEECEYCGRLFYTKQDYEPHLRTHTGDRPFRCTQCAFRAITRENLRRHMEREHENVTFQCKECIFVATSRTKLWNHQLSHLGFSGLQCPHCPDKFETIKRLRVHMSQSHPGLPREELDRLTGYKHKMQGKMGRRSYKCPYCERVFIRANSELQKHIWIHEGVKPFKCSLCSYACRSKNNLQAHMLRHSSHKPFACQECGKAYKSKTALRWHVRSHKTGNLFKCDKCPYEAQQRSHLKRHMETHEVMKRFVCQHCDYSANTVGYMKIHYARAHKGLQYSPELSNMADSNSNPPPDQQVFRCLSCDYRFGNLSDLKRHLKIKHHVQVQDIAGMEHMHISEVEVLQCAEETQVAENTEVVEPTSILAPAVSETVSSTELDEKTASAVTLLQQLINMQNQGAFGQREIKVMSEDGQLVSVNPETIIVQQQDGHQVLVTNDDHALHNPGQYIIQYVASDDPAADPSMEGVPMEIQSVPMEIQTVDTTESVEFITE